MQTANHHTKDFPGRFLRKTSGFCLLLLCCMFPVIVSAQAPFPPPAQIQVFSASDISFGSFSTGSTGGTVTVSPNGMRSVSGTVVEMGGLVTPAIFEVVLVPGRFVNVSYPPSVTLFNGPNSITMTLGPTEPASLPFVTTAAHPFRNLLKFGGTLSVGGSASTPPGEYSGTFSVTFIQE